MWNEVVDVKKHGCSEFMKAVCQGRHMFHLGRDESRVDGNSIRFSHNKWEDTLLLAANAKGHDS